MAWRESPTQDILVEFTFNFRNPLLGSYVEGTSRAGMFPESLCLGVEGGNRGESHSSPPSKRRCEVATQAGSQGPCSNIAMRTSHILIHSAEGGAGRGRKDLGGEILKRHDFSVVLNYCFKVQSPLFIEALVEWDEALHGPAGIDARGTYKAWQELPTHYGSVKQRPKKRNLRFLCDCDKEHVILHWVNND